MFGVLVIFISNRLSFTRPTDPIAYGSARLATFRCCNDYRRKDRVSAFRRQRSKTIFDEAPPTFKPQFTSLGFLYHPARAIAELTTIPRSVRSRAVHFHVARASY